MDNSLNEYSGFFWLNHFKAQFNEKWIFKTYRPGLHPSPSPPSPSSWWSRLCSSWSWCPWLDVRQPCPPMPICSNCGEPMFLIDTAHKHVSKTTKTSQTCSFSNPTAHLQLCHNSFMILKQNIYRVSQEKLLSCVLFCHGLVTTTHCTWSDVQISPKHCQHTLPVWSDDFEHTLPLKCIDLGMLERRESSVV